MRHVAIRGFTLRNCFLVKNRFQEKHDRAILFDKRSLNAEEIE